MFNLRTFSSRATIATLVMLGASVAHAGTEEMLTACIERFVATTLPDFQGKIHVQKEYSAATLPLGLSSRYEVMVSAADAAHGTLASAVCKVKHDGTVLSMTTSTTPRLSSLPKHELTKTAAVSGE